jgi:hypothetical protein
MPFSLENLAMAESDWPDGDWNREKSTQLAGPRRGRSSAPTPQPGSRNFMLQKSSSGRVRWPNSVTARRGSVRVGHSWSPTRG